MSADLPQPARPEPSPAAPEAALSITGQHLAMVFNSARDMMMLAKVTPGELFRVVSVNRPYVETIRAAGFPLTAADFEGRTFAEMRALLDADAATTAAIQARYDEVIRTGRRLEYDEVTRTPAGVFHGRTTITPIPDATGACAFVLYSSQDVTARVRAEQALRESEEKFAKAFSSSPQALIISDLATGRYIEVNAGYERITGHARGEVIGRTSLELGLWADPADRDELVRRLQRDGWARDLELRYRRKDGGLIVSRCSFELIELAGQKCLLGVLEDITEQRRKEDQRAAIEAQLRRNQKLEALGTLAGGIAHDFNNILTAIIVNQELALMDIAHPTELRGRLEEIGQASNRAKDLVRQILTFSRQQHHERLRQHLQMIVREALSLLRASLPATIEIKLDLSADTPPVLADASQVHQVVMNLCTNAAHAMQAGGGLLTVRLAPCCLDEAACRGLPGLRPGRHAQLTVADTGHGMDAGVLARIFEPFFTTKIPGEGTGLGLPMVHGIMQDHGGGVFVQSAPGAGTTFDLYFPEAAGLDSRAPHAGHAIEPGKGEMVLVVDDEEAIGAAIATMLRRIGYRTEDFTDPAKALERIRAAPTTFNLLLTDRTMPHLTGPALIAAARASCPSLPAVLMSGLSSPRPDEVAPDPGYDVVAKPIEMAELSRAVRRALTRNPSS